jgi:serine/threonine protein kinase
MSPENSGGFAVDARSDIYSLGCSLFEVLTGKIPFNGRTERETMLMHHSTMIPRLSSAAPDQNFPPELEQVVARMMAKAPADRYQSMASVAEDLKNLMEQKPLSTHQKPIEFKICDTQLAEELFRPTQSLEAQAPKAQALEAQSLNALPSKTQSLVRELPFAASQEKQITDDVEQCATTKNSISNEHIHQRRMMHYHLRIAVLTLFYLTGFAGLLWLLLKHPHIQFH